MLNMLLEILWEIQPTNAKKGFKDAYQSHTDKKLVNKNTFGFKVKIFNLNFTSHSFPFTNLGNISESENFLYFSKHYLLFILVVL